MEKLVLVLTAPTTYILVPENTNEEEARAKWLARYNLQSKRVSRAYNPLMKTPHKNKYIRNKFKNLIRWKM